MAKEIDARLVFDQLVPRRPDSHKGSYGRLLCVCGSTRFRGAAALAVEGALRGYKEINLRAMRLLPRGGYLATASCSHFMPAERFERMLRSAAADAGVELRQIEARTQASDHPILWNVPETDYLKFYLFQVV